MSELFLALALVGLAVGGALIAWPRHVTAPEPLPASYARRIVGALIGGASLFLGGFTLAAHSLI